MTKILVSDPITDAGMAILQDAGFEVKYLPDSSPGDKAEACKDVGRLDCTQRYKCDS